LNGLFEIRKELLLCNVTSCSVVIQLLDQLSGSYPPFNIQFFQQLDDKPIYSTTANIQVLIEQSKFHNSPGSIQFIDAPYVFTISESLKPLQIAADSLIKVNETQPLNFYRAGFDLDLLDSQYNMITSYNLFASDLFELTPNYGQGFVVSALKLKANAHLDFENGIRKYNYIVTTYHC
jgi:hypothetical protein